VKIAAAAIVLVLPLIGSPALAQGAADAVAPSACLARPTQACLLAEAFELLQSPRSPVVASAGAERQYDLEKIVELHANAGRITEARRVAGVISSRELSRIHALRMIGAAQAGAGSRQDAADSFDQAHQLIDARNREPLGQAGALLAMAKAEADAGLVANAARSLTESLELALRTDVNVSGCISPSLDAGLDGLLKTLAEEHAKAGDAANALRAARATGRAGSVRADALSVAAEVRTAKGEFAEARALLLEAVDAATASMSRQPSSNCPRQPMLADHLSHVQQLSRIAVAQARAGFADDAAASFAAAANAVDGMEAAYSLSREVRRSQALSEVEEALHAALRRSQALSDIAEALHAAGLSAPAAEALDRAVKAADAVSDMRSAATGLIRLAQAQHRSGQSDAARATLVRALERARAVDDNDMRAVAILSVVDAGSALGLAAATDGAVSDALAAARSTMDRARFQLLRRIVRVKLRSGTTDEAVALFTELLQAVEAIEGERPRSNALATAIRGLPMLEGGVFVTRVEKPLIAVTAQKVVRLAQSIQDARQRASILVMVAEGLPD
jgi:tetratricopeptide (TPR) repeat protein